MSNQEAPKLINVRERISTRFIFPYVWYWGSEPYTVADSIDTNQDLHKRMIVNRVILVVIISSHEVTLPQSRVSWLITFNFQS